MKKSIGKKINGLLSISLVVLAFFMVTINLVQTYRNTSRSAEIMLSKGCENQAAALNNQLSLVQQSVNNFYGISEKYRPAIEKLKNPEIADNYINQILDSAITIAENTDGAMAIYYRLNPDVTLSGTTGFFWVKDPAVNKFLENPNTDLLAYDVNDVEHVGWYYEPVWAGEAIWMTPYYNANVGVEMISYVVPVYEGPDLIGVIGMDVDFNMLKEIAEANSIYKNGGAVLCDLTNSQIYYNHSDLFGTSIPSDIYGILQGQESSDKIINYRIGREKYCLYYVTLVNRMRFLTYANRSEVFAQTVYSIETSAAIFVVIFCVTLILSLRMGKKITQPIQGITEATKQYAVGNWDVKVACDTGDELQLLAENVSIMADKTKEYIKYIQDLAKKDGLTGLRNKADYMMYVEKINTEYASADKLYSIVVFDVNNLKTVNDNYGHEKGDELIISASRMICRYFSHSPVFRIGGDEFVAIVDGGDYDDRAELIANFRKYMELSKDSKDIMDVCIACGIADSEKDKTYDEIFEEADKNMYENKKKLKGGVNPR